MSYFFGLGPGHLSSKFDKIAKKHGASLVNYTEPNGIKRHWFECRNLGYPFDRAIELAVLKEIKG